MLSPGQGFAGYRVLRALGAGGMGEVYLVQHPRLPREDALKVLPAQLSADATYRARFIREADLASSLDHPAIVSVYDRGEEQGQLWITMKYIPGSDASALIRQAGPFNASETTEVITAVGDALDYAHGRGLLHRDVKPANIMIDGTDRSQRKVYLTDFGIARTVGNETALTDANLTVGSIHYTAPEQLRGADLDGRADQYSLACTAFTLLTGQAPYPQSTPTQIINSHLNSPIPRASERRPGISPAVDGVLMRGMDKSPANRFASCADFARELGNALSAPAGGTPGYQATMINPAMGSTHPYESPQQTPQHQTPQGGYQQPYGQQQSTPQPYGQQPYGQQGFGRPAGYEQPQYAAYGATAGPSKNAGSKNGLILGSVLLVGVLLIAALVWMVTREDADGEKTAAVSSSTSRAQVPPSAPSLPPIPTNSDPEVVNGVPTQCALGASLLNTSATELSSYPISIPSESLPVGWRPDTGSRAPFLSSGASVMKNAAGTWVSQIAVGRFPSNFTGDTEAVARKFLECFIEGPGFSSVRVGTVNPTVRADSIEDSKIKVTIIEATIPVTGAPAGITGDEAIVAVVGSSPMTIAFGTSPTGNAENNAAVRKAVLGLKVNTTGS